MTSNVRFACRFCRRTCTAHDVSGTPYRICDTCFADLDTESLTLTNCAGLLAGLNDISYAAFAVILREAIKAREDYIQDAWRSFQLDPLRYATTRQPRTQGDALFALAKAKLIERRVDHALRLAEPKGHERL